MQDQEQKKPRRGRPPGAKNRRKGRLHEVIKIFHEENFETLQLYMQELSPKAWVQTYVDLLPYSIPKQQTTTMDLKMQALADSSYFDDVINRLESQHQKALQSQVIVQPLPIPQQPIPAVNTVSNEVQETEDKKGEAGNDDSDYEWIEVEVDE